MLGSEDTDKDRDSGHAECPVPGTALARATPTAPCDTHCPSGRMQGGPCPRGHPGLAPGGADGCAVLFKWLQGWCGRMQLTSDAKPVQAAPEGRVRAGQEARIPRGTWVGGCSVMGAAGPGRAWAAEAHTAWPWCSRDDP